MKTNDFDYELEKNKIAQHPISPRDHSKLMIMDRKDGTIKHMNFYQIVDELQPGDVLVLNDTSVLPARLFGSRPNRQESIEVLLLNKTDEDCWKTLVKPGKKMKIGTVIQFGDGELKGEVIQILEEGERLIQFSYEGIFEEILDQLGTVPLPPYITAQLKDKKSYQTIYSKHSGSAAAPTAGLHFTDSLLNEIKNKGVEVCFLTLHIGLGTFRPVKVENIRDHKMHAEYFFIPQSTCNKINQAKKTGRRVIAVGTTSMRALETVSRQGLPLQESSGWTNIFIYPGFVFRVVDGLITNFHLPKSTLLMLVSAFAKREWIQKAYQEAIDNDYRFFSFGDAMFIR